MRITTLLIDLDGVLRIWPANNAVDEGAFGLPAGAIAATAFEPDLLQSVITGKRTDAAWRNEVAVRLARAHPTVAAHDAVAVWSAPAGAVDLEVLSLVMQASAHCAVGLVTNATDRLMSDLRALQLAPHLGFVINSSEVGFAKPHAAFFQAALKVAGVAPENALFVDDSPANIAAARALGLHTHHFRSAACLKHCLQNAGLIATPGADACMSGV